MGVDFLCLIYAFFFVEKGKKKKGCESLQFGLIAVGSFFFSFMLCFLCVGGLHLLDGRLMVFFFADSYKLRTLDEIGVRILGSLTMDF